MKSKDKQLILGIESSCDETAAAIIKYDRGGFKILSNVVSSQVRIHRKYGGVVPEVAARNHIINIIPVIDEAMTGAGVKPKDINKIAVTYGPGLITSLLVGVETAKVLSCVWGVPMVGVNHLKAHVYAAMLQKCDANIRMHTNDTNRYEYIKFPAMALVVSGGHTELVVMKNIKSFKKVGQTLDDAAGEAFDKVAKILGLGYPGGPAIAKAAENGDDLKIKLPRPMIDSGDFNFSFSGLKTAVLYKCDANIRMHTNDTNKYEYVNDMAASFQRAVVEVLTEKTVRAALQYGAKTVILAGGVAANNLLRETLAERVQKLGLRFVVPDRALCTDNAAMVGVAGFFEKAVSWRQIKVNPNLEIGA